ncbi:MAG: hypothetical protein ACPGPS_12405 [Rubripirellula sp.]
MSTYRSPSINGMTLVIVTGWLVINLLLFLAAYSLTENSGTPIATEANRVPVQLPTTQGQSWMAGVLLGLITFISWLATSIRTPVVRFSARIMASLGCVLLLTVCCTPDPLRHAINVTGIILLQPIIFVTLAIPCWTIAWGSVPRAFRLNEETKASQQPNLAQFHVGELITMTTLIALLLATSRQYTPPVASLIYWPVLICVWCLLQAIACLTIRVVMFGQIRLLVFLVPAILLTAFGLAKAEGLVSEGSWRANADLKLYSFLLTGFTISIAVLCASGGGKTEQNTNEA